MANMRRKSEVRLLGVARPSRAALTLTTALQAGVMLVLSLPAGAQPPAPLPPNAQPQGGAVVAGAATISQNASSTTINQASQRAAVNWQGFNVGSQQAVTFNQPSASAVALNRVVGPDPSQIAGRINANGQIVLVNQSGVVFTQGSQVNVAGLMVSAAGISNQNFMAGRMKFDQPAHPNAVVENRGNITVKQAGLAALAAPQVVNSGTITATLGHVVLAGATTATLDMYGDGLLALDVTNQVTQTPVGANGANATALVTNSGMIVADGGIVQLTARAADGIVQTLVRAGGKISAASAGAKTGTVALNAVGGSIVVEGQLGATGDAAGTTGGAVEVLASHDVTVAAGATVNVSGQAGGGVAAIGTMLDRARRGPSATPAQTAGNVTVRRGATIAADATQSGKGGRVVLLSGDTTHMDGAITARGGAQGGDGGFVEVSGTNLGITGALDVSAPHGAVGTILLDPIFLNIVSGTAGSGSEDSNFQTNGGTVLVGDGKTGAPDTISTGILDSFSGNVLLEASRTITVASSVTIPNGSLTLQAGGGNIVGSDTIDGGTIIVNSGVVLAASGDVVLQTGAGGTFFLVSPPLISLLGAVDSTGGSVSLLAGQGGTVNFGANGSAAAATGQRITIQADTLTVNSGAGSIVAPSGTVEVAPATSTLDVTLGAPGGLSVSQSALSAVRAGMLEVGAVTLSGTLTVTATGIVVGGAATLPASTPTLALTTFGAVSETSTGALTVGMLVGNTGQVDLSTSTLNAVGTVGSFTVSGDFILTNSVNTTLAGPLVADNVTVTTVGATNITVTGAVTAAGFTSDGVFFPGTLALSSGGGIAVNSGGNAQGNTITLVATTGIALNGTGLLGATTSAVDLSTTSGGVTEASTATLAALSLTSSGGVTGNVSLLGTSNAVLGIDGVVVSPEGAGTGNFAMNDTSNLSIGVNGITAASGNVYLEDSNATGIQLVGAIVTASGGFASFQTDAFTGAGGSVTTGTFEIAPDTPLNPMTVGSGGTFSSLGGITSTLVRIGGVTEPGDTTPTTRAGTITVVGSFDALGRILELDSNGLITGTAAPLTNVGTLIVAGTAVDLSNGSNTVTNLGDVTVTSFTLKDSSSLDVIGSVTPSTSALITSTGLLTVDGAIASPTITLTSGSISIPGTLSSTGTVTLFATTGTINETGTLTAGTLTGSANAAAILTGATPTANSVAGLGNFSAAGFTLDTGGDLLVSGAVAGGTSASILDSGTLTVSGSVGATAISLTGSNLTIPGVVNSGTAGTVGLFATTGTINETGTLTAGTLTGSAFGAASLTGATPTTNSVAGLGSFSAAGFTLDTGGDLLVSGAVTGGASASIVDAGLLTVSGSVGAGAIGLTGGNLTISGVVNSGTAGTVGLFATTGTINETGTLTAGTLTGSASGRARLVGATPTANSVGALGDFSAAGFTLDAGGDLVVSGIVAGGASASILGSGTLTVSGSVGATAISLTGSNLTIFGVVSSGTAGTVGLFATTGTIGETGTLTAGTLTGTASGRARLVGATPTANSVGALGDFSAAGFTLDAGGDLVVSGIVAGGASAVIVDAGSLTVSGSVGGTAISLAGSNLTISGFVNSGTAGTVGLFATTGTIGETGTLTTGTLTGGAGGAVSLTGANSFAALGAFAAVGDLSVTDGSALLIAGAVSAGRVAAPNPANTATLSIATGGALQIGATGTPGSLNGGTVALAAAGPISEPNGTVAANTFTATTTGAGDIVLANPANQIAASTGIIAFNGSVVLVDDPTLSLTGPYSGSNLFFEVSLAGGSLGIGGATPATLSVPSGGRITLVADAMTATAASSIAAPQGKLELAPFSAQPVDMAGGAGAGTLELDATLFGVIGGGTNGLGTLLVGGFTDVTRTSVTQVVQATAITLSGTVALGNTAVNLGLLANGPVSEPGGVLAVATLFGATSGTGGDFVLDAVGNAIGGSTGITASNGGVVLVDGTSLTLTGLHSGNNLFFEVAQAGGTLSLGAGGKAPAPASLQASNGGRVSLVADTIVATGGSSVLVSNGTVQLAPFSAINVSLMGTAGVSSGLVLDSTLLSDISTGTLLLGGFTDVPAGAAAPRVVASSLSVDGTADLTGIATTLLLDASGPITQPGGPLSVAQLGGSGGNVTLMNTGNGIGTLVDLAATAGNLAVADTGTLAVAGTVTGNGNVFLTAPDIAIGATGQIGANAAGLASLQTDTLTLAAGAAVSGGTFEIARATVGTTVTLGTAVGFESLAGVTTSFVRIGAVTLPGAAAPTTTAGAILVAGTFDAAGLPVELDATGPINGTAAPLVNVGVLSGSGGAWTLTAANVSVAALGAINASSFALSDSTALTVGGPVLAGSNASISAVGLLTEAASGSIVAGAIGLSADAIALAGLVSDAGAGTVTLVAGTGGIVGTGTLVAGTLTGSTTGTATLGGSNTITTLGDFTAAGFTLGDTRDLTVRGSVGVQGGPRVTITDTGTLTVASGVSATAVGLTAAAIAIPGTVSDGGAGTVNLVANEGGITGTGTLVAGTLSGSATGAVRFGGTDTVATLGSFDADSLALTDGRNLLIAGTLTAPSMAVRAPGKQITLGNGAVIATTGGLFQSASFAQSGLSSVTGAATLQIDVTGNVAFDPRAGLQANGAKIILDMTNGSATGNLFVRALDVTYTTPGSANLFGTIQGASGQAAAPFGSIQPAIDVAYRFNNCTIAAVTCTPPPPQPPPPTPTPVLNLDQQPVALSNLAIAPMLFLLQTVVPQVLLTPQDQDDLLQLPVVSEQDY